MQPIRALQWIVIFLCCVVLFLGLTVLPVALATQTVLLEGNTWSRAFERAELYADAVLFLEVQLSQAIVQQTGFEFSNQTIHEIVSESFSKQWFDVQLNNLVLSFFDFVNSKQTSPALAVSFVEPKQRLPKALEDQLPVELRAAAAPTIASLVDKLPDQFSIREAADSNENLAQVQNVVSLFKQAVLILAVLIVVLVVAIAFLIRNKKAFLVLGLVFLLSGVLATVFSGVLVPIANNFVLDASNQLQLQASFSKRLPVIVNPVFEQFFGQVRMLGLAWVIAGIVFIGAFIWVRSKQTKTKLDSSPVLSTKPASKKTTNSDSPIKSKKESKP